MSKLTNVVVQEFLADFEAKAKTTILEEGKEKNELAQIAKARGLDVKNSRDLALFKTVYAFTDKVNYNGAILPKKDLLKALPQIIGKPVNVNHERNIVVGHYVDYRYIEKENKIIAYGVFYKSYFPKLWEDAQNLFKKKKLSSSFEIWSPKDKRKIKEDGSYELHQMEIAGGALIYEDDETAPAFKNAKVLALAKKEVDKTELVYASKYKEDEMITSEVTIKKTDEQSSELPETLHKQLKCSNCTEEFEVSGLEVHNKCPKCFAIVNNNGEMIYPPQIKDFRLLCYSCKVNNWLILSNKEDKSKIRCLNCAKEYEVTFKKSELTEAIQKLNFLYSGVAYCIQCGNGIVFEGSSKIKQREFTCNKCGLTFPHDISKTERNRIIISIEKIEIKPTVDNTIIKEEEGGEKMELNKKEIEKAEEKDEAKLEDKTIEPKVEKKTTEKPAEESSQEEKAPKVEEKVEIEKVAVVEPKLEDKPAEEPKEEVKIEEKPKLEDKIEDVVPADIEYEEQFTDTKEDDYEMTISKAVKFAKIDDSLELEQAEKWTCECLKCGQKIADTVVHCNEIKCPKCGGEMRRANRPGKGQPSSNKAKKLTYQERKALPDNMFAVVVTIKNKKTHKERKIRKYLINDKANIRYTLSQLSDEKTLAMFKKLGVDVKSIRRKVIAQAKKIVKISIRKKREDAKINTEKKLTTYKNGINKVAKQLIEARKQVELYKTEAKKIITRREELGDYPIDLTDEDIVNDEKFEKAKLERENVLLKASKITTDDIVGGARDDDYYKKTRDEINKLAFGDK